MIPSESAAMRHEISFCNTSSGVQDRSTGKKLIISAAYVTFKKHFRQSI
jgi:hypothetical protein